MKRRYYKLTTIMLAGAAVLTIAPVTPPANARTPSQDPIPRGEILFSNNEMTVRRDGNWIRREYVRPLNDSSKATLRGRAVAESGAAKNQTCRYSNSGVSSPNDLLPGQVEVEREVAYDQSRCIVELERAVVSQEDPAVQESTSNRAGSTEVLAPSPPLQPETKSAKPSESVGTSAVINTAIHKTYFEDPLQLDVNTTTAEVSWQFDGTCVTYSQDHWGRFHWLNETGWRLDSRSASADRACGYATTTANAQYSNGTFCTLLRGTPQPTTYTEYTPTLIQGRPDGRYYWYYQWYRSGGCREFLFFHSERTYYG